MLRTLFTIVGLCAICHSGFCQSTDVALWEGFTLKYKINDQLSVAMENHLRLDNNISQLKTAFTNVSASYKISDPFRAVVGYRFSLTLKQNRHRFYGGVSYRYKMKPIRTTLNARIRFQQTVVGNERSRGPEYYLRPKLALKYDVKGQPISLFTGAGTWYNMTQPNYGFDRYRVQFGLDYDVSKRNTIGLIYQYQNDFNVADRDRTHIFVFEVSIDITQKKKKKKDKEEKE